MELIRPKTIFASDFEYIFMCRFLPFWLPGPTATSVLLWRSFGKCFLNLILPPGVELVTQTFSERAGQEEKSNWEDVSSHPARAESRPHPTVATLRRIPWTKSFKSEGGCGLFLFGGSVWIFWCVCVNCA